jgi:hypothetical protein
MSCARAANPPCSLAVTCADVPSGASAVAPPWLAARPRFLQGRTLCAGALHLKRLVRAGAGTTTRAAGACPEHASAPGQDHMSLDWQPLGRQVLIHQLVSLCESPGVPVWSRRGGSGGLWQPPAVDVRPTEGRCCARTYPALAPSMLSSFARLASCDPSFLRCGGGRRERPPRKCIALATVWCGLALAP